MPSVTAIPVTAADVVKHFETNALGTFLCCQHVGLMMVKQSEGGLIVNLGDWAEVRPGVVALANHLYKLPARLVSDPFDSAAVLREKPAHALHLHGRRDELVPFSQAEALAAITGGPLLAEEGGHNDCPLDWQRFVEQVMEFVGPANR